MTTRRSKRSLFGKRRGDRDTHAPSIPPDDITETPSFMVTPTEPEQASQTLVPRDPVDTDARIGPWRVEQIVARTTGSCMVIARHSHSQRIKATLKVLEPDYIDDEQARRRLVHEGEVLFPLDHQNIIGVRNLMLQHVPPYLELDPLQGESLAALLEKRSQLYMAEALDLTEQLLGALEYLHERQVYHRDLQPRNLMVRKDGVLTVFAFGRAVEGDAPLDDALPTALPYLAPEWPEIDDLARADLYAAGVLLYQLLTGKRPFNAPNSGGGLTIALVLKDKASTPFLDPGPRFRQDLRTFVRHLTTREPDPRPASAAEALARLLRIQRSYA